MDDQDDIAEAGEFDETRKLKASKPWLALIDAYGKAGFRDYQDRCNGIEKQFANSERLASVARDREFQMFWANLEVLKPSIYSRPPVPVVVPRFKDRKPIPRVASELLERSTVVAFEMEDIDEVMRGVRDDLALLARGVLWVRYEAKGGKDEYSLSQKVCIETVDRNDFAHDPARKWKECGWVAKRSWLTKEEMRQRFRKHSGNAYQDAEYAVRKDDNDNDDGRRTAGVWELWHKHKRRVVWVAPGVDVVLDEGEPHLTLEGFFPCPRPAYGTVQPRSLVPVPDFLFYKDQLEEINELTARISSLTESLRLRGFYPAGAGEIGDAIEAAVKSVDNRQILVPVNNWAMLGSGAVKDTIVWLPLDMVATTITALISLRQQLFSDIYEITGLSDIMRGSTDPNETLGAQQLKSQYGSVRVRDRQNELVRIGRDVLRIMAEIMAENFQAKTLLAMAQMELPSAVDLNKQVKQIEGQARQIAAQVKDAQASPELQQAAQQNPEQAQQIMQQAQQQIEQLGQQAAQIKGEIETGVTIENVMAFLRDQRLRPFALDIETDSTIQADENAEKQRRAEFLTALGGALGQLIPMVQGQPQSAPFAGEVLKFATSPFRVGREMEATIDELVENMKQLAGQGGGEQAQQQAEAEAKQQDLQMKQQAAEQKAQLDKAESDERIKVIQADAMAKDTEANIRKNQMIAEGAAKAQKHRQDMEKGTLEIDKLKLEIGRVQAQTAQSAVQSEAKLAGAAQAADIAERSDARQAAINGAAQ